MPVKPETKFAKAEAQLIADHRRILKRHGLNYDDERARYGAIVADHNAGFERGWDDGYKKGYRDGKNGVPPHVGSRKGRRR